MRICLVYICAYIVLVCIGMYIHAHVHYSCTCNDETRRAFVPCILWSRFIAVLSFAPVSIICAAAFIHAFVLLPFHAFCRLPGTFCHTFSKRLQRSFYAVFRAVLSVYSFRAYICTVCPISCGCMALFAANLPFCGGGGGVPPKGQRREAQLRSHRILYFLIPKKFFLKKSFASNPMPSEIFFLENSLSPFASCLPFTAKKPAFLVPLRVCVPTRPHKSPNLLKETPF